MGGGGRPPAAFVTLDSQVCARPHAARIFRSRHLAGVCVLGLGLRVSCNKIQKQDEARGPLFVSFSSSKAASSYA